MAQLQDAFRFRVVGLGSLSEEQVEKHFSAYGEVLGVEFTRDPFTNGLTGNGSVRISGFKEDTAKRISEDEHEIAGQAIKTGDDYERKIFIGGFKDVHPDSVRDYFKTIGEVEEFDVAFREKSGRPRGYAFLRFVKADDMERALASPSHTIEGRPCLVKRAEARPCVVHTPREKLPSGKQAPRRRRSRSRSRSRSCSRTRETKRRGGKGGLQVAPGYSYEDGVGARPTWANVPAHAPPHHGHGWPAPPPSAYHLPSPGYEGYNPYPDYGRAPPGHGPPPPGYRLLQNAYGAPLPDAYGHPPPPDFYGRPPLDAYGYPLPGHGAAPPSAYRHAPPSHGYGLPPADYGHPPPGYGHPPVGYGPPPGY